MATGITVGLDDSLGKAKIRALEQALANPRPLYATIGRSLLTRIKLCFKFGIDPWGNPWQKIKWRAPRVLTRSVKGKDGIVRQVQQRDKEGRLRLTKAGAQQAAANVAGKAGHPLSNTGLLRNSISALADDDGVTVGTNLRQARAHQFGATIRPVTKKVLVFPGPDGELIFAKKVVLPARPYLPLRRFGGPVDLPPAWALQITNAIRDYLRAAAKES